MSMLHTDFNKNGTGLKYLVNKLGFCYRDKDKLTEHGSQKYLNTASEMRWGH